METGVNEISFMVRLSCLYMYLAALVKSFFFFPLKTSLAKISTVQMTATNNVLIFCAGA